MPGPNLSVRKLDKAAGSLFLVDFTPDQQLSSLGSVFHSAPVGLCVLDLNFRYVTVNPCFAGMYRLSAHDFVGRTVDEVLPEPAAQIMAHLRLALAADAIVECEIALHDPAIAELGRYEELTYLRTAQPVRDISGKVVGISVALLDITSRKRAETALRESEEDLRCTVELTPHIPWTADPTGELTFMSPRWHSLTGRKPQKSLLHEWALALHPEDRQIVSDAWQHSVATGEPFDSDYRVKSADTSWRWMRARAYPRRDDKGEILRWYGTVEDIHDRKVVEAALQAKTDELAILSQSDHLTGLANRRRFDDALGGEIERARRSRLPLALILIDVDHFKLYNDTGGHLAGDECLRIVAHALDGLIRRPGDLAARFGGEEFAIVLPNTTQAGAFDVATSAIITVRKLRLAHAGTSMQSVTISAGVAMLNLDAEDRSPNHALRLIEAADSALYKAKLEGRDRVALALI